MKSIILSGSISAFLLVSPAAQAQVESNFAAGGGVKIGYSASVCDGSIAGALRYNSASGGGIDFCDGTNWLNVGGAGSSSIDSLSDAKTDYATDHNLFMGLNAGNTIQSGGQYNLSIGATSGDAITTGDNNLAIGHNALGSTNTGSGNIAIGRNAIANRTTNSNNIAIGTQAAASIPGDNSVVIGHNAAAGSGGSAGANSVVIGESAMIYRGGSENIAIGQMAMGEGGAASNQSVAIGYQALVGCNSCGSMSQNVAVGYRAGRVMNGGSQNTILGYNAGPDITSGSRNIAIGASVTVPSVTGNDQLNIGNLIYGNLSASKFTGINEPAPAYTLHVNGDIAYTGMTVDISDARRKENIEPLPSALSQIMAMTPVSFTMKDDPVKEKEYGFIAQDIEKIYPALVKTANDEEQTKSMNYIGLIAPLVKALQEQQDIIAEQQKRLEALEKAIAP